MDNSNEDLQMQLIKCRNVINKGYTSIKNTRLPWLNTFCLEFLQFSKDLHTFLAQLPEKQKNDKSDDVEIIYLCLTQIVTCIRHMENTIKAEEQQGAAISASRQHFLDRILWCLDRLRSCLKSLTIHDDKKIKLLEENSFVELMDRCLDLLSVYSSYKDEDSLPNKQQCINEAENRAQALFDSKEIRAIVDLVLGHTLAFANVALQQDKKALSALCQKVLRDCMAFQEECATGILPGGQLNESMRKLKATSLEYALYRLEDYINEALLRLVCNCFLDFNKFSIDKLRQVIKERGADDPQLDELIADFDVNVDRITQIGMFAIAFAPNMKIKTIVRSCLASFESLDSCIIPSLQTKGTSDIFAKLLEKHFNEEFFIFKNSIQEIIDSQAFASCYFEILTQTINHNDKTYDKESLEDVIKMAEFLYEHFQLPVNNKELLSNKKADKILELLQKFYIILQECQAVLKCQTLQLEPKRVIKRFKVLRSILRKLTDELSDNTEGNSSKSQEVLMSEDLSDSQQIFSSLDITPSSIKSILYNNTGKQNRRKQCFFNHSLKGNYSKLNTPEAFESPAFSNALDNNIRITKTAAPTIIQQPCIGQTARSSLRRKESLRTALFKRQKSCESDRLYSVYKNSLDSLQISEILDQLSGLSSNLSKDALNKSFISS